MTLTLPEEIMLLMLDDATGRPVELPAPAGDWVIAAAILMELCLEERIATEGGRLVVRNPRPSGDPVLDEAMGLIAAGAKPQGRDCRHSILALGRRAEDFRARLLERLVSKGVLREEDGGVLRFLADPRYPKGPQGEAEVREVRARLRRVLLEKQPPDHRDALLIGLMRAAGLVPLLLSPEEEVLAEARVEEVAALEELGRSLSGLTREVFAVMLALAGTR
ncbi:MAG: GPP34 family phosphoprotein [Roseococcus sp.]|nr:GPP34 family phosphoprotein [Roseococcus sp.]